jgi:hypothetical protein
MIKYYLKEHKIKRDFILPIKATNSVIGGDNSLRFLKVDIKGFDVLEWEERYQDFHYWKIPEIIKVENTYGRTKTMDFNPFMASLTVITTMDLYNQNGDRVFVKDNELPFRVKNCHHDKLKLELDLMNPSIYDTFDGYEVYDTFDGYEGIDADPQYFWENIIEVKIKEYNVV